MLEIEKVLCEALDCKEPYETDVTIDGFRLCSFFNYYYANAVYAERVEDNLTVGWDQYENQLYIEGPNFESKQYTLTKQPELTANIEEVRNMLPTILAEGNIENFPVSQFLDLIDTINKDILANYPIYWDEEHQGHRKVAALGESKDLEDKPFGYECLDGKWVVYNMETEEVVKEFLNKLECIDYWKKLNKKHCNESVPKENVKDCYKVLDEYVQKLGFEPYREADWNVSYRKGDCTNYIYYIHFTPVMDEDQLKLAIYKDTKLVEQDVWTVQDVEDIKKAFDKLIISKIEGME